MDASLKESDEPKGIKYFSSTAMYSAMLPFTSMTPMQMPAGHTLTMPFLQKSHTPQNGLGNTTTRSPFLIFPPAGTSSMTPDTSCPIIIGGIRRPVFPI